MRGLVLVLLLAACGDDDDVCVGADAAGQAMLVSVDGMMFQYGAFDSQMARDCGGESVTIAGDQLVPPPSATTKIALCLPDRNAIDTTPIALADLPSVSVGSEAVGGCTYGRDFSGAISGTVTFAGWCKGGGQPFAMTFAGSMDGTKICPQDGGSPVQTPVTITLAGTISSTGFVVP